VARKDGTVTLTEKEGPLDVIGRSYRYGAAA
jgi:hypothetical protein